MDTTVGAPGHDGIVERTGREDRPRVHPIERVSVMGTVTGLPGCSKQERNAWRRK